MALTFSAEQELEIKLSLYRRTLCLTNNLMLDVPITSCIPKTLTNATVYEIQGTQYHFSTTGQLIRQRFSLQNPLERDSTGKLVYSVSGIPNFMSTNLITASTPLSRIDARKLIKLLFFP